MSNQVGRLSGAAMRNLSWRSLALKNHWLKFERTNKVVTKHISPFEQNVMTNMADAKFLKGGAVKQIEAIVFDMSPGILFLFGTYYWGNWQFKKNVDSLRS